MHGSGRFEWTFGIFQRPLDALVVVGSLLLLLPLLRCTSPAGVSAETRYHLIENRFVSGDLQGADQEASEAAVSMQANSPVWAARFRLLQARIEIYQGQSEKALALLQPELPAELRDGASQNAGIQVMRDGLLAIARARTHDLPGAEAVLRQADVLHADEWSESTLLLAKGIIAGQNGKFEEAEQAFDASLEAARGAGDEFQQVQALLNIAVVSLRQDHYEDALERFDRASALAARIGSRQVMEKAQGNAAMAIYRMGDFSRALAYAESAEKVAHNLGSPIDEVAWMQEAGQAHYQMNDLKAARVSFQRSFDLAKQIRNDEEMYDALFALASVCLKENDLQSSLALAHEAQRMAMQSSSSGQMFEPLLLEAEVVARQGNTKEAQEKLILLLNERDGSSPRPFERWQIESALAKVYEQEGNHAAADKWYERALDTFRLQRNSLSDIDSKLPFGENATDLYDDYMQDLLRQGRSNDALLLLDRSRTETLTAGPQSNSLAARKSAQARMEDPSGLARRLHGTILVYSICSQTSYLWAVSPSGTRLFQLPGWETLRPLVESHIRAVVTGRDVLTQPDSAGGALYNALVAPARASMPDESKVYVLADGELSQLNFETLVAGGKTPHFLIEDLDLVNARSLSQLAAQGAATAANFSKAKKAAGSGRLLLVGDPVYTSAEYVALPNAKQEVAQVAGHFAGDQRALLTGVDATRSAYLASHPDAYRYIHFVAHATASETVPLDSAVVLSAQPGQPDVYKLYARDIMNSKLRADLVTISACYGSGVRSYSGEGLVGLAWAFLRAGSHNVVGALWEVSDASTPQLMDDLYGGLAKGQTPDVALRAAKLAMLRRGNVFRKPFYWGAFQLYSGA